MAKLVEAMNATTTPERLAELAADPDAGVRRGVARHPATPPAALERLAADQDAGVRWGVAWHQAAPAAALERGTTRRICLDLSSQRSSNSGQWPG